MNRVQWTWLAISLGLYAACVLRIYLGSGKRRPVVTECPGVAGGCVDCMAAVKRQGQGQA